ncbi:CobW family GTP-binding protein [Paenibacillus sp. B01]|uniref:CobW family GTP-binding protein n=1 Tax=Paenibacillus sp. B01 TaxID=2660554 RepID=UPI001E44971D|nr:GTP-binding protein [Paenibacillus sp. B01]
MNEMIPSAAAPSIPVVLLGGFLGSGKTTLLARLAERFREEGKLAAVILNELGDVAFDELPAGGRPVSELLSGCICCSMKADLTAELLQLADRRPDVILVEATGAANPLELVENVMEASLHRPLHLAAAIAVVDGPGLLQLRKGSRRTYRLLTDGIRCATHLVLNKADKLHPEERVELEQLLRELNGRAKLAVTVRAAVPDGWLDGLNASGRAIAGEEIRERRQAPDGTSGCGCGETHAAGHACAHGQRHEHLLAVSYYPERPFDSVAFEQLLRRLPDAVYRAKGIVTFADTPSRYLFQYAFREADFVPTASAAPDAIVFIGEHFSREELLRELAELERL